MIQTLRMRFIQPNPVPLNEGSTPRMITGPVDTVRLTEAKTGEEVRRTPPTRSCICLNCCGVMPTQAGCQHGPDGKSKKGSLFGVQTLWARVFARLLTFHVLTPVVFRCGGTRSSAVRLVSRFTGRMTGSRRRGVCFRMRYVFDMRRRRFMGLVRLVGVRRRFCRMRMMGRRFRRTRLAVSTCLGQRIAECARLTRMMNTILNSGCWLNPRWGCVRANRVESWRRMQCGIRNPGISIVGSSVE